MLRLLTLASVAGFAAAGTCNSFDCTLAIAGGVQAADVQTVSANLVTVFVQSDKTKLIFLFFLLLHLL